MLYNYSMKILITCLIGLCLSLVGQSPNFLLHSSFGLVDQGSNSVTLDNLGDSYPPGNHPLPTQNISLVKASAQQYRHYVTPSICFSTPSVISGNGIPLGTTCTNLLLTSDWNQVITFNIRSILVSEDVYTTGNNTTLVIATYDLHIDALMDYTCIASTMLKSGNHIYGPNGETINNPGQVVANVVFPNNYHLQLNGVTGSTAHNVVQDERYITLNTGMNTITVNFIYLVEINHSQIASYALPPKFHEEAQIILKIIPVSIPSSPNIQLAGRTPIRDYPSTATPGSCIALYWETYSMFSGHTARLTLWGDVDESVWGNMTSPVPFFILSTSYTRYPILCNLHVYNPQTFAILYAPQVWWFPSRYHVNVPANLNTAIYCQYFIWDIATGQQIHSKVISW